LFVETDPEFTNRLKEDRKYLSKGSNRKPLASKMINLDFSLIIFS